MKRRLFNLAAAVSLVLFLATATLGLRSDHAWDEYHVEVQVRRKPCCKRSRVFRHATQEKF